MIHGRLTEFSLKISLSEKHLIAVLLQKCVIITGIILGTLMVSSLRIKKSEEKGHNKLLYWINWPGSQRLRETELSTREHAWDSHMASTHMLHFYILVFTWDLIGFVILNFQDFTNFCLHDVSLLWKLCLNFLVYTLVLFLTFLSALALNNSGL